MTSLFTGFWIFLVEIYCMDIDSARVSAVAGWHHPYGCIFSWGQVALHMGTRFLQKPNKSILVQAKNYFELPKSAFRIVKKGLALTIFFTRTVDRTVDRNTLNVVKLGENTLYI